MMNVTISDEIKEACSNTILGVLRAKVKVNSSSDELLSIIDSYCDVVKNEFKIEEVPSIKEIKDGREIYKKLGKSPGKYRMSSEALIRRIIQGKGLYRVNNIVDINNLISIKSKLPVGSYDLSGIGSNITLVKAKEGQSYKGIGKDVLNIESLPVLSDEKGPFGSPTSDSERAMIKNSCSDIIMCIYSFSGENNIKKYLEEAEELLSKYAEGKEFEINIFE